jgi:uncharacterized membrane protein YvbJ
VEKRMMGNEMRCPECGLILYKEVSQCPRCFAPITPQSASPSPVVERVYEDDVVQKTPKERKNVRRIFIVLLVIVTVICVILALSFYYIIPRLELDVITQYKESSGLSNNVDFKVKNEGTLNVQHFTMNITVLNSTEGIVAEEDYYVSDIDAHTSQKFNNTHFFGDQYENYEITLNVQFESEGKTYTETYTHKVGESMQIRWEDKFMQWGG